MNPDSFLRYNKEQLYAVTDAETCNLNLAWPENRPWQWAWLIGTRDRILSITNVYVKWPNLEVSKEAAIKTRYDPKKIERLGVSPEEASDRLDKEVIYNRDVIIVGHNFLGFDTYIHNTHRLNVGKRTDYSYLPRVRDTSFFLKGYKMGMQPRPDEDLLAYQMKLANTPVRGVKTNVQLMCREFDIPYSDEAHDAEVDVQMQYAIWKKTIQQVEI